MTSFFEEQYKYLVISLEHDLVKSLFKNANLVNYFENGDEIDKEYNLRFRIDVDRLSDLNDDFDYADYLVETKTWKDFKEEILADWSGIEEIKLGFDVWQPNLFDIVIKVSVSEV